MQQNRQPQIKSFRLTTKKKLSIKCYSEQKTESNCSDQSSFSSQYNMLTKRLKIKSNVIKRVGLGSTVSTFGGINSFRVRTQSSHERVTQNNHRIDISIPYLLNSYKKDKQLSIRQNNRYSTQIQKGKTKIKFLTNTKIKRNFKIQRPSIYWQTIGQKNNQVPFFDHKMSIKNQQLKISTQNIKSKLKILQNCKLLWNIRKQMKQKNNKIKPKQTLKAIKLYIMRRQQRQDANNGIQKIFTLNQQQNDLKQLIANQRIFIIGIVELINLQKVHHICLQCVNIMDNLIGFYFHLLNLFKKEQNFQKLQTQFKECENLCKQFISQGIQQKKSLTSTYLFICTKLQNIYRYSPDLFRKFKSIQINAKKFTVNRSFYDLLTKYAVYLNQNQSQTTLQNSYLSKHMASFTTCPSPFIIQPRKNKNYTLVLDLDQTLLYTKFQTNSLTNYCINYRPYSKQFVANLSKYFQIVIFTSSISSYAEQVIIPFINHISHILCRQHTIKMKGATIKDLNRIGRSLQTTIIIDNLQQNFKLHVQNGIHIKSWYGDKNDEQLYKIQSLLLKVVKQNKKDVRECLKMLRKQNNLKQY